MKFDTVEQAYEEMKKRGWGFARNKATGILAVGPYDGHWVEVYAMDEDPIRVMEKAIEKAESKNLPDD